MSALTKIATALALLLSLGAQAAEGAGEATEEKVLRLYNWSDYFAPDTLSEFTRERDPGHLRRDGQQRDPGGQADGGSQRV
ncbi:hypothetical protein [Aeromonas caviae]|uniref:hypothetical protein n=1 Tax=Aeromonas caviae TaxID=648 RepID=UPI003F78FCD8